MEVHEDGYKDLMEEGSTYGTSGVLIDGGNLYLQYANNKTSRKCLLYLSEKLAIITHQS